MAIKLQASKKQHLKRIAEIIKQGGIVAFPFNGVFGLFGDIDNIGVVNLIIKAKNRPHDKKLIAVCTPEIIDRYADFSKVNYSKNQLVSLLKKVHALGVILPASVLAPNYLTIGEGINRTILIIWTEYHPLRVMIEYFYSLGGRGLVGTSANKSGEATHFDPDALFADFKTSVSVIAYDRFDHLSEDRRKSTTIIDLTQPNPILFREGNVSEQEVKEALKHCGFPELHIERDVITVHGRTVIQ